jgi:hypothetical protein
VGKKIRQIRLTHAQRTWLRGVYSYFGKGIETNTRALKVELLDRLPKGFDPFEIDQRLLRDGIHLTVLGWALLDPESQLVIKTNRVIKCVRGILQRNQTIEQIHVNDVAVLIDMAVDQVAVVFAKLMEIEVFHDYGTKFGPVGLATIRISEQAFDNYLKYESVEQVLAKLIVDDENGVDVPVADNEVNAKTQKVLDPKGAQYDVFLSYAAADKVEANQIYDALTSIGVKPYLSGKNLKAGDDFAEEIREALRESAELWLLLTPQSLNSEWVISEWSAAWFLGIKIIPILHGCSREQVPERIRKFQFVDFSKHRELIADKFSTLVSQTPAPTNLP